MATIYRSEEGRRMILDEYRNILAAWPVQNKQYQVPTSFGEAFVIESGNPNNPALVLLHGSMSNSFSWFSDVILLSQQYHVFAVDLIGEAGKSAQSRPAYQSGAYQQWLDEVITGLGLEVCSIAGTSLGGWMALRYATIHPNKVIRLVLLCPGGLAMQRRDFLLRMLIKKIFAHGNSLKVISGVLGMDAQNTDEAEAMRKVFHFILMISKYEKPRLAYLPVFRDDELSRLTMPILVVFGDGDMLLNAKKSIERIQKLAPKVTCVLLPNTGHAVINQAERILHFLQGSEC